MRDESECIDFSTDQVWSAKSFLPRPLRVDRTIPASIRTVRLPIISVMNALLRSVWSTLPETWLSSIESMQPSPSMSLSEFEFQLIIPNGQLSAESGTPSPSSSQSSVSSSQPSLSKSEFTVMLVWHLSSTSRTPSPSSSQSSVSSSQPSLSKSTEMVEIQPAVGSPSQLSKTDAMPSLSKSSSSV